MRVNFFKQRRNQRYNYTPRYYQGKDLGNIYSIDSKFHKYKEATNAVDFGSQWSQDRQNSRTRGNREINFRLLIIMAILVLLFLWVIDFDLSIFTMPQY